MFFWCAAAAACMYGGGGGSAGVRWSVGGPFTLSTAAAGGWTCWAVPLFLSCFRFSRKSPKAIRAAPATAEATPEAMGTTFEDPCVVPDDIAGMAAGVGAGVGANGVAGVTVDEGVGVDATGEIGPAEGGEEVVGVGDEDGGAADGEATVVGEGVPNAPVSSITATKSDSPRLVDTNDPYVLPAKMILPSEIDDIPIT